MYIWNASVTFPPPICSLPPPFGLKEQEESVKLLSKTNEGEKHGKEEGPWNVTSEKSPMAGRQPAAAPELVRIGKFDVDI